MAKYRKIRKLKSGGQGVVWQGSSEDDEPVAMKYLLRHPDDRQHRQNMKRFEHEVKCHTTLDHPGVMSIIYSDLTADEPYFVMPLASGQYRTQTRPGEPLPRDHAISDFFRIVDAVAYAHKEGVIHRDLKPGNILMLNGRPVVSDFGLGRSLYSSTERLTRTNAQMGTPGYSAPEQFGDARNADASADVYALGVLLSEMLTGQFLPGHSIDFESVPPRYRYIVMTCVQRHPKDRYPSAAELQADLARFEIDSLNAQAPILRAERLVTEMSDGDKAAVGEYLRLLIENEADVQLYLRSLVSIQTPLLAFLGNTAPAQFSSVIRTLCRHAIGQFTSSFVDRVAYFLKAAFPATVDLSARREILICMLKIAVQNDREYPIRRFIEICESNMPEVGFPELLADVLGTYARGAREVSEQLRSISNLPEIIDHALRAQGC